MSPLCGFRKAKPHRACEYLRNHPVCLLYERQRPPRRRSAAYPVQHLGRVSFPSRRFSAIMRRSYTSIEGHTPIPPIGVAPASRHRPMATDQRLRRRERITRRSDFLRVFACKRKAGDGGLLVYVAGNGLAWSRIGISVKRRLGSAVQRHYVRRRIREAFRRSKSRLPQGLDIVVVVQPPARDPRIDLTASLCTLTAKAERLKGFNESSGRCRSAPDKAQK